MSANANFAFGFQFFESDWDAIINGLLGGLIPIDAVLALRCKLKRIMGVDFDIDVVPSESGNPSYFVCIGDTKTTLAPDQTISPFFTSFSMSDLNRRESADRETLEKVIALLDLNPKTEIAWCFYLSEV